jgi:hypothetical protein
MTDLSKESQSLEFDPSCVVADEGGRCRGRPLLLLGSGRRVSARSMFRHRRDEGRDGVEEEECKKQVNEEER